MYVLTKVQLKWSIVAFRKLHVTNKSFPGSRFNQCFGVFGVLDRLHGTDAKFRQSKQYERHTLLTSLTPLNESIPDSTKKGL